MGTQQSTKHAEVLSPASLCSSSFLAFAFSGRKPTNVNLEELKPDATKASKKAEGPAMGITWCPAAAAAATRPLPGSLIKGMPARLSTQLVVEGQHMQT